MRDCPYCKGTGKARRFKMPQGYVTLAAVAARVGRCWKTVYKHMRQGLIDVEVGERESVYKRGKQRVRAVHVGYMVKRAEADRYVAFIEAKGRRKPQKRSDEILRVVEERGVDAAAIQFGIQRQSVLKIILRRKKAAEQRRAG